METLRRALVTLTVAGALATGCASRQEPTAPMETVAQVDLSRYSGKWYEIARIPNRFQDQCRGAVTAEYERREDGRMAVLNRCRVGNGGMDEAHGVARVVDSESNAKLEVSFVNLFGWQLFWGDYWIIGLGPDYEYSVVGTPDREYGWILSRTPDLGPQQHAAIERILQSNGYDPRRFKATGAVPATY